MGQEGKCGQDGQKAPFGGQQMDGPEGPDQEGDFRNPELQKEPDHEGSQHQFVAQMPHPEYGCVNIPHPHGVKELGHAENRKGVSLSAHQDVFAAQ